MDGPTLLLAMLLTGEVMSGTAGSASRSASLTVVERPFSLPYVEAATDLIALNNVSVTPMSDEPYLTEASGPVAKTRGAAAFPNFLTLHALSFALAHLLSMVMRLPTLEPGPKSTPRFFVFRRTGMPIALVLVANLLRADGVDANAMDLPSPSSFHAWFLDTIIPLASKRSMQNRPA